MSLIDNRFARSGALIVALTAVLLGSASAARAQGPLTPGKSMVNPASPLSAVSPIYTAGPIPASYNILVASTNFPYTPGGSFSGFVVSKVFANNAGQLAFSYTFNNLVVPGAAGTDIVRATVNDFTNPWTGVNIFDAGADGSGHSTPVIGPFGAWANGNPFDIQRNAGNSGIGIDFSTLSSGTELLSPPSDQSATIWLTTDATHFAPTKVGLSDNGSVGTGLAYAPAVPEPATIFLVIVGMVSVGASVTAQRRSRSQRLAGR
jgi:hypothetical protein